MVSRDSLEYFERRERAERAAAKNATCSEARRVHQELAQHYAALVRQRTELVHANDDDVIPDGRLPLLTIISPSIN